MNSVRNDHCRRLFNLHRIWRSLAMISSIAASKRVTRVGDTVPSFSGRREPDAQLGFTARAAYGGEIEFLTRALARTSPPLVPKAQRRGEAVLAGIAA